MSMQMACDEKFIAIKNKKESKANGGLWVFNMELIHLDSEASI